MGNKTVAGSSISCYACNTSKGERVAKTLFPPIMILVLLAGGCVPFVTPDPAATSTPLPIVAEWTVKMIHSGGVMGLMRTVEVSSDGNYTVTDDRTNNKVISKLNGANLATLNNLISSAELQIPDETRPTVCADCFIYDIKIQSEGKNITTQLNDITLPGSGMEGLVAFLRELTDKALK